jgi:hypothetical protein
MAKPIDFKHFMTVDYKPGSDDLIKYMAQKRKRSSSTGEGGPVGEEQENEALNLQQRMKRSRMMKKMKSRIKIGRERAKRKMASKEKLDKRSMRAARNAIVKKITKDIPKSELSFARKQEIEKRLDKPAVKERIKRLAKRMFPKIRKAEVQRKKG